MTEHNVVIDENQGRQVITREGPTSVISRVITIIASIITGLIALRILLTAFGANRDNGFADLIYSVTHPLVSPFFGLFNQDIVYAENMSIEVISIFALVVYWLIAWALIGLLSIGPRREKRVELH